MSPNTNKYRPRIIDQQIERMLPMIGAIQIKGPKWCGKTTTAERHAKSVLRLQDPLDPKNYEEVARLNLGILLEGKTPRLIDEWQTIPQIWNGVRTMVDQRGLNGQFILTGSSTPVESKPGTMHSGAGRIATLNMRTMSLYESGDSNGNVSLGSLFDPNTVVSSQPIHDAMDIARLTVRGGWPSSVVNKVEGGEAVEQYCKAILESDINVNGRRRNREKMEMLLRSLSRNIATSASNPTILKDLTKDDELPEDDPEQEAAWSDENGKYPMSLDTLRSYMEALRSICLVEDMPAWQPKLRTTTSIRSSETRYLTDPSIGAHFLGADAEDLIYDPDMFGLLFENLVARDLRVYAESLGGKVRHYRDKNELEVDSIIHLRDGRWGAIEVKLSSSKVKDGTRNLLRLEDKVDVEERNKLSFLAVVTGDGYAYTDSVNGVKIHTIPIGCLKN